MTDLATVESLILRVPDSDVEQLAECIADRVAAFVAAAHAEAETK
jgi:hypothetical protein